MTTLTNEQLQAIMQAAITAVNADQATTATTNRPRVKNPERPEIDLGCSETQWAFFVDEWAMYKRRTSLMDTQLKDELRGCCSKDLRVTLFNSLGSATLTTITEADLLQKIKAAAVIGKNKAVHRKEFYELTQAPEEPLNRYTSKLRAKADLCNFTMKCSAADCEQVNNYGVEMIKDQMITGLYDKDIQQEVLAKDKTLTTFDTTYDLIESYELGKRAKSQLETQQSEVNAIKSQYKSLQSGKRFNPPSKGKSKCIGCGSYDHTSEQREELCRAWGKKCFGCGKPNHHQSVCNSTKTDPSRSHANHQPIPPTAANAIWSESTENTSYFLAYESENCMNSMPHVEWNGKEFAPTRPHPLPSIDVKVTPLLHLHEKPKFSPSSPLISAYTDTCAQTCVAGETLLDKLNLSTDILIPTSHRIVGVTKQSLDIIGVLLATIHYRKDSTTNIAIYICRGIRGLFLSKKAQIDLGIISSEYPSKTSICAQLPHNDICDHALRVKLPPRPDKIPFEPTEENREKLQNWFLDYYGSSAFNDCDHQPIPLLTGKPLDIHFKENVTPVAVHTPIPVPHHVKHDVDQNLAKDVRLGVIEPIPQGVPTTWCSRALFIKKKSGKIRRTVDYSAINRSTLRETHHTPSPFNLASSIPPNSKKTCLDAWNGYHSLPLSDDAKNALTFITESGRYRPITTPQGFHGSGDGYTKRADDITVDFPRHKKCVDDTLLYDDSIATAFWHTVDYIHLCHENGVIFNKDKFHFAKDYVEFAGFDITEDGMKPTEKMVSAIANFPKPTNLTDLQSFFGLLNQVSFVFSESEKLTPFRELLKKDTKWYWDNQLDVIFNDAKKMIINQVTDGIKSFEINRPCCIWTDWSKDGVGFSLFQKHCDCSLSPICCKEGWKLILAKSRFTTDTERRYAPIEGEALALVYALTKSRMFIVGCPRVIVACDHKPLTKIFGDKSLEKIDNTRLFALKEKSMTYDFEIKYVEGIRNKAADALSRHPVADDNDSSSSSMLSIEIDNYIKSCMESCIMTLASDNVRAVTVDRVKTATIKDKQLMNLINYINNGFPPEKCKLPNELQCFWNVRNDLSVMDNNVLSSHWS